MYIPRGYLSISQAIVRIMAECHSDLLAEEIALEKEKLWEKATFSISRAPRPPSSILTRSEPDHRPDPPPWTEAEKQRSQNLRTALERIELARLSVVARLREAFAEADLAASVMDGSGIMTAPAITYWRTDAALSLLRQGLAENPLLHKARLFGTVLLKDNDFDQWLASVPNASSNPALEKAMPCEAAAAVVLPNKTGPKPQKHETLVAAMIRDFKSSPNMLSTDTQENLANHYQGELGAKPASKTVQRARLEALAQLSRNTPETVNTNK